MIYLRIGNDTSTYWKGCFRPSEAMLPGYGKVASAHWKRGMGQIPIKFLKCKFLETFLILFSHYYSAISWVCSTFASA